MIVSNINYWDDDIIDIDGYTCSQTRADSDDPDKMLKAKELYMKDVFMTCAIGNEYDQEYNKLAEHKEWVSVGACKYNDGKPKLESYSSRSEYLTFVSITNMETELGKFTGSSCATPVLQAMAMLVQNFFIEQIGRKLTNIELFDFIMDNCHDLGEAGRDDNYGYGLFILPDPATIDIKKYVGGNTKKIYLTIDNYVAFIDDGTVVNKAVLLDSPPKIIKNRTMVPIRFIAEELGCKVEWNESKRQVIIIKED